MSAVWRTPDAGAHIFENLPDLGSVQGALSGLAAGLRAAQVVVHAAEEVLAFQDPLSAIALEAVQLFQQFMASLLESDVYALPIMPVTWGDLLHPYTMEQALLDVSASLNDTRDGSRPVFNQNDAFASITFVVGANNWADFGDMLRVLGPLFSGTELNKWTKLADISFRRNELAKVPFPRTNRNSQGVPWDWTRSDWENLIPGLGEALRGLVALLDTFSQVGRGIGEGISDLIEALTERLAYIESVLASIAAVAEVLAKWKELLPRMKYVYVSGAGGGSVGYVEALQSATRRPEYKLTAGITFAAFGANPDKYIEMLGRLIGLRITEAEAAVANAQRDLNNANQ